MEEYKTEKWGKNANEEWNEKWGEIFNEERKEKWTDKWTVDLTSGFKKGENWGQIYDENNQPKHHWAETWDDNGNVNKRNEHY